MDNKYRMGLNNQLREAYGKLVYTYTTHLKCMNILQKRSNFLMIAKIILSALSSGGIFSTLFYEEFYLKLLSAVFSSFLLGINLYFRSFDASSEINQHRVTSDKLWTIRENYISLLTDFSKLSDEEIRDQRDDLQAKTYSVYSKSIKTFTKGYEEARKALKYNEEQFFNSDEIDQMLPIHLRNNNYFDW